jgi:hypothetical protein
MARAFRCPLFIIILILISILILILILILLMIIIIFIGGHGEHVAGSALDAACGPSIQVVPAHFARSFYVECSFYMLT